MSAGDIDDRLGPSGELAKLRALHSDLDEYLKGADDLPILSVTGIPYGAGISTDGLRRYVNSSLSTDLDGVDLKPALATHESVEWALREFCGIGEDYEADPKGHRLANRAEYEKVTELFAMSMDYGENEESRIWDTYDDFLGPQLAACETAEILSPPADLAMYPYVDTPLYDKIREAQRNG
jgi:hypothetical protein